MKAAVERFLQEQTTQIDGDIIKYDMTPIYLRILKKNLANVNDEEKLMINYIA